MTIVAHVVAAVARVVEAVRQVAVIVLKFRNVVRVRQALQPSPPSRQKNGQKGHHSSWSTSEKSLTVIEPVNAYYWTALDYHTYFQDYQSPHSDNEVARTVAKMTKRLEVQLKSQNFDGSDLIFIPIFLPALQITCTTNGIHEGPVMWLFYFFMEMPAAAALSSRTCLINSGCLRQEGKLTSQSQVINYLLVAYATDDIIAEANLEITSFKEPESQKKLEYAQTLWTKALRSRPVYSKSRLDGPHIEGFRRSIKQSVHKLV